MVATQNKRHCSERSKYSSNRKNHNLHEQSKSTKVYDYGGGLQTEVIEEDTERYKIRKHNCWWQPRESVQVKLVVVSQKKRPPDSRLK